MATRSDEGRLYDLLLAMHRYNDNGWGVPFRPEEVLQRIEVCTRPEPMMRTCDHDRRRGIAGVIDGNDGLFVGSVGLFIEPIMWFNEEVVCLRELWTFVRPEARHGYREFDDLIAFSHWVHDTMKADLQGQGWRYEFPFECGFLHRGRHFGGMMRLWRRWRGEQVGVLFRVE